MLLLARGRRSAGEGRLWSSATGGSGGCCGLAGDRILRPELGKVGPVGGGQLATLEPLGELLRCADLTRVSGGRGHQPREDRPLGHLQPLGHGWDPGEAGRKPRDVRLHVRQKLLQLVQNLEKYYVKNSLKIYSNLSRSPCGGQHWQACCQPGSPWTDVDGSQPGTQPQQTCKH